jgi:SUMO ligase MMS21 Smc5/6 complex component
MPRTLIQRNDLLIVTPYGTENVEPSLEEPQVLNFKNILEVVSYPDYIPNHDLLHARLWVSAKTTAISSESVTEILVVVARVDQFRSCNADVHPIVFHHISPMPSIILGENEVSNKMKKTNYREYININRFADT